MVYNKITCDILLHVLVKKPSKIILPRMKRRLMKPNLHEKYPNEFITMRNAVRSQRSARYCIMKTDLATRKDYGNRVSKPSSTGFLSRQPGRG